MKKVVDQNKTEKSALRSSDTLTVYHNVRCSKSRDVCTLLKKKKVKTEVVEYLKTPPTQKELKGLLKMLGMKASELVRTKEPLYKEKYEGKKISEAQWLKILSENPILIERPIIVKGDKAVIGRPTEKVLELL
jgi:arsenate reductase (glutaredoxin)